MNEDMGINTYMHWLLFRIARARLGFLHSEQFGKPSPVCDFMELYRCLVDDFLIQYCQGLRKKDFKAKFEDYSSSRKGKREYLRKEKTRDLMERLYGFFESYVDVARIKHGNRQTVESLINEEALLLAKFLRDERKTWTPRIAISKEPNVMRAHFHVLYCVLKSAVGR